jgi:glutamate synthase (NADPH/NADH) large chain
MAMALVYRLSVEPEIEQVFVACPDHITNPDDFERKLFLLRNYASHTVNNTVKKTHWFLHCFLLV